MLFRVYYNQRSEIQEEHRRDLEVIRMLTKQQKTRAGYAENKRISPV